MKNSVFCLYVGAALLMSFTAHAKGEATHVAANVELVPYGETNELPPDAFDELSDKNMSEASQVCYMTRPYQRMRVVTVSEEHHEAVGGKIDDGNGVSFPAHKLVAVLKFRCEPEQ